MKNIFPILASMAFICQACQPNNGFPEEAEGYMPIYMSEASSRTISSSGAQDFDQPTKIYTYNNYSFQVDAGSGIHIIDISDPANAEKVGFINVIGASEIAIKQNVLYTNNGNDLVAIDISDMNNAQESKRIEDIFPVQTTLTPPGSDVYFECVDESKGIVIGWQKQTIKNPKCYKP